MINHKITALSVNNNDEDFLSLENHLDKSKSINLESTDLLSMACNVLRIGGIDIVLLDLMLPDSQGLKTFDTLYSKFQNIPIIVMVDGKDEALGIEAVQRGAQNYLIKSELSSQFLAHALRYALEQSRTKAELDKANDLLQKQAIIDPVTHILNRRGFEKILYAESKNIEQSLLQPVAIVAKITEIEGINQKLGSSTGDALLLQVAENLKSSIRPTDYVARISNSEFLILLIETRYFEAQRLMERIKHMIMQPIKLSSKTLTLKVKIGITKIERHTFNVDKIISQAQSAADKTSQPRLQPSHLNPTTQDQLKTESLTTHPHHKKEEKIIEQLQKTKDISDKTKLEYQTKELKRSNEELEQFAYIASHDLQEPLRKIMAFSNLLVNDLDRNDTRKVKDDIHYIIDASNRMQNLVQSLLELSRIGSNVHFKDISIDKCVDTALETLSVRIKETGAQVIRKELPTIQGDSTTISQLYQNLISNALKYTKKSEPPTIEITGSKENGKYVYGVKDHGIGIESEFTSKVFLPFKRLHGKDEFEGSGIGLAICKKIVNFHGGTIWVESEGKGLGCHFKFTLERENGTSEKAPTASKAKKEAAVGQ